MRHRRKDRHFLLHTFEHLFGVLGVLVVAFTLGFIAKQFSIPEGSMLASTGDSATMSTTSSFTTTTSNPVSFSAMPIAAACSNGATAAKYTFGISPELGGYITITGTGMSDYVDGSNGRGADRYFPVGTYTWTGVPKPGFIGSGSGTFTVTELCASVAPTATTSTSNTPTGSTVTPPPPSTALIEAVFAVQPDTFATCNSAGLPLTNTTVLVLPTGAGEVLVSSNTGMSNAHLEAGEYPLPNGHYTWYASARPGYVGVQKLSGSFDIANLCTTTQQPTPTPPPVFVPPFASTTTQVTITAISPTTTTTTTPKPVTTTAVAAPVQAVDTALQQPPRPQLSFLIDSVKVQPVATRIWNKETLEVRVVTALSSSVDIYVVDGLGGTKLLGHAEQDELLSRAGQDVWAYIWDISKFPETSVRIYAKVKHTNGTETVSERSLFVVKHPVETKPTTVAVTAKPIPKELVPAPIAPTSSEERKAILSRISDPSSCTNAEECHIYCNTLPGVSELCAEFAQKPIDRPASSTAESLADGIADERLAQLLPGGEKHAKELPEVIANPEELRAYCADMAHADQCTKILVKNDMGAPDVLLAKREAIISTQKKETEVFEERTGARAFIDTDADGVTDYDEVNLYHTDPRSPDTDSDGFLDGAELLSRTNPRGGALVGDASSTATTTEREDESVKTENPIITGVTHKDLLAVSSVAVAEMAPDETGTSTVKKIKLAGHALPNTFVTLYIFSDPIVVTVKTDAAGVWTYTLDKELPNGSHEVYSAITDSGGRILAKSEPLPFVKTAAAVSFGSEALSPTNTEPGFFSGTSLYAMIAVLIGVLGVAFSIIGFIVKQRDEGLPGI